MWNKKEEENIIGWIGIIRNGGKEDGKNKCRIVLSINKSN